MVAVLTVLQRSVSLPGVEKERAKVQHDPVTAFSQVTTAPLACQKLKTSDIKALSNVAAPLYEEIKNFSLQLDCTTEDLRDARNDVTRLEQRALQSEQLCIQRENEIATLRSELEKAHACNSAEQKRSRALEEYWKETSDKQRNEIVFKVRSRLEHEVNEIRLCLDRSSPNVAMAMDRVKKIEEFLASVESI